jgi:hypothetical protein
MGQGQSKGALGGQPQPLFRIGGNVRVTLFQLSMAGFLNEFMNLVLNNTTYKRWVYDRSGLFNIVVTFLSACLFRVYSYKSICLRSQSPQEKRSWTDGPFVRDGEVHIISLFYAFAGLRVWLHALLDKKENRRFWSGMALTTLFSLLHSNTNNIENGAYQTNKGNGQGERSRPVEKDVELVITKGGGELAGKDAAVSIGVADPYKTPPKTPSRENSQTSEGEGSFHTARQYPSSAGRLPKPRGSPSARREGAGSLQAPPQLDTDLGTTIDSREKTNLRTPPRASALQQKLPPTPSPLRKTPNKKHHRNYMKSSPLLKIAAKATKKAQRARQRVSARKLEHRKKVNEQQNRKIIFSTKAGTSKEKTEATPKNVNTGPKSARE